MQIRFSQVLAGMRQAQRFLDENDTALSDLNRRGSRVDFDALIVRLAAHAERQAAHQIAARGELASEKKMARRLRNKYMLPVVKVARAKVPAAAQLASFTLPPFRSNSTDTATRAQALAAAAVPYRALLQEGGLPQDFVEALVAAAAALEAAVRDKKTHQSGRVAATDNILDEVTDARTSVATMDALVRSVLPDGDPRIAEWAKIVRDIRGNARRAAAVPPQEVPSTIAA
jgi:hypothetical protein